MSFSAALDIYAILNDSFTMHQTQFMQQATKESNAQVFIPPNPTASQIPFHCSMGGGRNATQESKKCNSRIIEDFYYRCSNFANLSSRNRES